MTVVPLGDPLDSKTAPRTRIGATSIRGIALARLSSLFKAGVPQLLISFALFQGASFIIQLIAARLLGPAEYGQLRILDTIVVIALIPATSGIPSAMVTYVAAAKSEEDRASLLFNGTVCGVVVATLAAVLMALVALTMLSASSELRYLAILSCLLPFATVGRIIVNYYQGLSQLSRVALYNGATSILTIALAVLLIPIWRLEGWVAARVLVEVIFAIALVMIARRHYRALWQWNRVRLLASFGFFAALGLGVARAQDTAFTLYIAHFGGSDREVGNFGLAFIAFSGILLIPGAVNAAILPKMASQGEEPRRALTVLISSLKYTLAALAAVGLASAIAYPIAIRSVFGEEYNSSIPVFFILLAGTFVYAIASGIGTLFFALGQPSVSLAVNACALISGFAVSYVLIPRYGINGAAVAVLINTVLRLIGFGAVAYFRLMRHQSPLGADG